MERDLTSSVKPEIALDKLDRSEEQRLIRDLVIIYHGLGNVKKSDEMLASLVEKSLPEFPYNLAWAHSNKGEIDLAFEYLQKSIEVNDPMLNGITINPVFDRLHNDPRWIPLSIR